ncbi:MAG: VanW family protein [Actinomycetota bacterium]|nr:VanW family protein [Actinomycetota bacterium]
MSGCQRYTQVEQRAEQRAMEVSAILKRPGKKSGSGGNDGNGRSRAEGSSGRRRGRRAGRVAIAGPILIVCAIVAVLAAFDYSMNSGQIYRGVSAGSVDLGGMTPAQAEAAIREEATGALQEVNFTGPEEYTFSAEEMGIDYDIAATVEEAYGVGREGGVFARISDRFQGMYGNLSVEPDVDFEPERSRSQVESVASELNAEASEAEVDIVGPEVAVADSAEGYSMDTRATMENVNAAVEDMDGEVEIVGEVLTPELLTAEAERAAEQARGAMDGQLVVSGAGEEWTVSPAAIGASLDVTAEGGDFQVALDRQAMRENLGVVYQTINQAPVEASYDVNGTDVSVSPSQEGRRIENQNFLEDIEANIFGGQREFQIPVAVAQPEMTTEQAEAMRPTELLGEYSTNYLTYDDTPGRVTNLEVGSDAVNGQLVAPGEVFSFNALASQYEYESAGAIIDGQVDEADGGGLCQVSSTLYMAANYAGLEIVERHPHFAELPYIQPGFDATVWFGALDMQFRNTTDGYILVEETLDEESGEVYSAIHGVPQNVAVEMDAQQTLDTTDAEGNPVTEWDTFKTVSRNGQVEFNGLYHTDRYEFLEPGE